jgi:hypothetical protein
LPAVDSDGTDERPRTRTVLTFVKETLSCAGVMLAPAITRRINAPSFAKLPFIAFTSATPREQSHRLRAGEQFQAHDDPEPYRDAEENEVLKHRMKRFHQYSPTAIR